jgi:hypothetical protein
MSTVGRLPCHSFQCESIVIGTFTAQLNEADMRSNCAVECRKMADMSVTKKSGGWFIKKVLRFLKFFYSLKYKICI